MQQAQEGNEDLVKCMQQLLAKKMPSKNEQIMQGERWILMIEVLNTTYLGGCWLGRG
jgi:hypothetical protein